MIIQPGIQLFQRYLKNKGKTRMTNSTTGKILNVFHQPLQHSLAWSATNDGAIPAARENDASTLEPAATEMDTSTE